MMRLSSLSTAARQWFIDGHAQLVGTHSEKSRRVPASGDRILDAYDDGELYAVEIVRSCVGSFVNGADREVIAKLAARIDGAMSAVEKTEGGDTLPGLGLDCGRITVPLQPGPTGAEPRGSTPQSQEPLFPLDAIDQRISEISRTVEDIKVENKRLFRSETESKNFRLSILKPAIAHQEAMLLQLRKMRRVVESTPSATFGHLQQLGFDFGELGLDAVSMQPADAKVR